MSGLLIFRYSELSCGQVQSQRGVPGKYSKAGEEISKMIVSSLFSFFLFISSLMRLQTLFLKKKTEIRWYTNCNIFLLSQTSY